MILNIETTTILIVIALIGFVTSRTDDILRTKQGLMRGSTFTSRNKRDFKSFQKIPYAKPPIGDLRFRDPIKLKSWKGILDATVAPPMCIQKNLFMYKTMNEISGEEDCLYLNVYTPKIPKNKGNKKHLLPVMFWIPGGGFSSGDGGKNLYGPNYLLDKDVVVVSINYRVGPLGFLSTEDDIFPGNYGMKDQVLALKWVQDNIYTFGGNPEDVTIFGESAGAASVGLHLLSPMSKNLFHKAIMESGTSLCRWAVSPPGWAKRRSSALGTIAECPSDPEEFAKCLREMPAESLVNLHYNFFEWSIFPSITFMPVVENKCTESSFLCKYPLLDFKQESTVPVLMGMNTDEGGIFAARLYNSTGLVDPQLKDDFSYYISSLLLYKHTTKFSDLDIIGEKLINRYFPDGNLNKPKEAVKMISGGIFLQGVFEMATKLASPVYFYVYGHQNEFSFNSLFGAYPYSLGVTHGDEMTSLFYTHGMNELDDKDLEVSKVMIDIWTYFVINKKPTINGRNNGRKWPIFDTKTMKCLFINSSEPFISKNPYLDEYAFWQSLPLLSAITDSETADIKTEL